MVNEQVLVYLRSNISAVQNAGEGRIFGPLNPTAGKGSENYKFWLMAGENAQAISQNMLAELKNLVPYNAQSLMGMFKFIALVKEDIKNNEAEINTILEEAKVPTDKREGIKNNIVKSYTYNVFGALLRYLKEELKWDNTIISDLHNLQVKANAMKEVGLNASVEYFNNENTKNQDKIIDVVRTSSTIKEMINAFTHPHESSSQYYRRFGAEKSQGLISEKLNDKPLKEQKTYLKECQKLLKSNDFSAEGKVLLEKIHDLLQNKPELKSKSFFEKIKSVFRFEKKESPSDPLASGGVKKTENVTLSVDEVAVRKIKENVEALAKEMKEADVIEKLDIIQKIGVQRTSLIELNSKSDNKEVKKMAEDIINTINKNFNLGKANYTVTDKAAVSPKVTAPQMVAEDHPMTRRYNGPSAK